MTGTGGDADFIEWARRRVGAMVKDKYRVESLLGVGGMACVYSATHRNGRRVALKVLHPELSIRGDLRTRFRREGQVANAVGHPGAVAVIDDDVDDDGSAFLVMELLEGQVVERLWERSGRRLSAPIVLAIAREVCEVLVAAHENGIVHRDIKPENLFLTSEGQLKILDFGLAQLTTLTRSKDTHTGMVFGTPAFMPPEQASGRVSQIDERTDLWSVGATMFTLLSGAIVHEGESAQHIVMLAAMEPARSLAGVLPGAHPALAALVDRALTHDKDLRWPNAAAMRDAICATSRTLFGEERPDLPRADELTLVGVPVLGDDTPRVPRVIEEEEQTRTDRNLADIDDAFSEGETTQTRDRVTPVTNDAPPAPSGAGWSALRNVIETGGSPPPVMPEAIEETTQLHATRVMPPTPEEHTSVMNIDLRGSTPRISGSYQAVTPSRASGSMQAVAPAPRPSGSMQAVAPAPRPSGSMQAVAAHPSGPPAASGSMKPRPPTLGAAPSDELAAIPRVQAPTARIHPPRASMLPWAVSATAIAIAIVAIGFAVLSRAPKTPDPPLLVTKPSDAVPPLTAPSSPVVAPPPAPPPPPPPVAAPPRTDAAAPATPRVGPIDDRY
ncbi:MAG: protein kinase [Labilithrix sp.]|nr:protein kinase [Labilithrix sp.]MCW5809922.1 protein kinase [Labilithrix sp.]